MSRPLPRAFVFPLVKWMLVALPDRLLGRVRGPEVGLGVSPQPQASHSLQVFKRECPHYPLGEAGLHQQPRSACHPVCARRRAGLRVADGALVCCLSDGPWWSHKVAFPSHRVTNTWRLLCAGP